MLVPRKLQTVALQMSNQSCSAVCRAPTGPPVTLASRQVACRLVQPTRCGTAPSGVGQQLITKPVCAECGHNLPQNIVSVCLGGSRDVDATDAEGRLCSVPKPSVQK